MSDDVDSYLRLVTGVPDPDSIFTANIDIFGILLTAALRSIHSMLINHSRGIEHGGR